jgi:hypothetical protein
MKLAGFKIEPIRLFFKGVIDYEENFGRFCNVLRSFFDGHMVL